MEFDGEFTLEGVTSEEVWLALSDPVMIKNALPGCKFLTEIEGEPDFDELEAEATDDDPPTLPEADPEEVADRAFVEGGRYATLVQMNVGGVNPRFETVVSIDSREFPRMDASATGSASDSSFEMDSGMTLVETDGGVTVEWWAETDVFGRVAQMGQRVISPVAKRVINRFFNQIESNLSDVSDDSSGLRDRIKGLL
ncbi:CoxG family protein [Natrialba swarupiae]|uniref:Carbon monoxide dehydrogenase n=1 Tax=Natrialba swarupiae TaxID=2448032 RepID=A0A5D5ARU6_9EURY|nr:SRPBCC domain-containing protein [Natrialba swarupiae]TYT62552.1 carbon monoxide dehydrogenase [Natrialba swarupiae]